MPELKKIETSASFTPEEGSIVEFFAEENGKIVLKAKKSDGSIVSLSTGGGVDTADATATEYQILAGYTAYINGGKATGRHVCPTPEVPTYPTLSTTTYIPGTADQIIQSGYLLTGNQIIKGDANLLADNIAEGVTIFGVTGKHAGEGTVTSDADVTASDVSAGVVFYGANGKGTGTMPDVTATLSGKTVTVPAGRIREKQTLTVPSGSVSVDGGTVNISAGYIEAGTLSVEPSSGLSVSGAKVTVGKGYIAKDAEITIPSGSVSIDGNKVTVVEGYVTNTTLTVSPGSVSISGNTVTVAEGYVQNDTLTVPAGSVAISEDNSKVIVTEGYVMDEEITLPGGSSLFRCAAVYGPKKVSGFIVSGAGTAAVNGNYIPTDLTTEEGEPIYKHETSDFYYLEMWGEKGICTNPQQYPSEGLYYNMYDEGWYPGNGGTEPAPEVTASDIILNANVPKTWDGYKIEKSSDGAFSVASALTTGLPYAHITPVVGNVYTQDGLVKTDYIRMFRSGELLIIPLVSNEWKADTGQTLTIKGGDRVRLDCGCTAFLHNTSENYVSAPLSVGSSPRTFTAWLKSDGRACSIFSIWSGDTSLDFGQASDGSMRAMPNGSYDNQQSIDGTFVDQGVWRHYAIVLSSGKFKAYLNGEYVGETDLPSSSVGMEYTSCRVPAAKNPLANNTHYVRDFRVYSRELSAAEILAIFNENNPVK